MAEAQPALATIVFTDLVGSTALRTALGEERADSLRRVHDELLQRCVDQHAGTVVKGGGDGIMAAFDSAAQALAAAVEMQRAVTRYGQRSDAISPLPIRIGLSVGDVSWEGGDCFGTPVVEAARLEAAAGSGQILCSDFVKLMARGRGGLEFLPVGDLDLKGLPEPVSASEVVWRTNDGEAETALPLELRSLLRSTFAGRTNELSDIVPRLTSDEGDYPTAVWLVGEPGIGKSRLAAEVAAHAADRGATVLFGRCSEDLAVTHQPFVEALRAVASSLTDAELAVEFGHLAAVLCRLLPQLHERLPGLEALPSTTAELEQFRLFEAVRQWLVELASGQPVVLVLDDLHCANRPTISLVSHILRTPGPGSLSLVSTARSTTLDANDHLVALIDELARFPSSQVFRLEGLSEDEVELMVGDLEVAQEIRAATAGNPLMVTSVLDARSRGESGLADISSTVRARTNGLPIEVQQTLQAAALCELEFDGRVIAQALNFDEEQVLDHLDLAIESRLVQEVGVDIYRFEHGLVRTALREQIRPSRRARMHMRIARSIEEVFKGRLDDHVAELAYHYFASSQGQVTTKAVAYLVKAAEFAAGASALDEAVDHYERALHVVGDDARQRCELLLSLGRVQRRAGHNIPAASTFEAAVGAAEKAGDGALALEAAIELENTTWRPGVAVINPLNLLTRIATAHRNGIDADDHGFSSRIDAAIGRSMCFSGQVDEGSRVLRQAVDEARRSEDPADLANALAAWCIGDSRPGSTSAVLAAAAELKGLADRLADEETAIHGRQFELRELVVQGDIDRYRDRLPEFVDITDEVRSPFWRYVAQQHLAMLAFQDGRLDDAVDEAERALEIAEDLPGEDPTGIYGLRMFAIRREQDRLLAIGTLLARLLGQQTAAAMWRPGLGLLHAELDEREQAREVFDSLAGDEFANVPRDSGWPVALGFLIETCVYLGDRRGAEQLYEEAQKFAGLSLVGGSFVLSLGSADRYLGQLAMLMEDLDLATTHLEVAVTNNIRIQSPLWEGHAHADLAALRRACGEVGAAEAAMARAAELGRDHSLPRLRRRATDFAAAGP